MGFLSELVKETRRAMETIGRDARSRRVEDVCLDLARNMGTATIEDLAQPIVVVAADEVERCSAREEEDLYRTLRSDCGRNHCLNCS